MNRQPHPERPLAPGVSVAAFAAALETRPELVAEVLEGRDDATSAHDPDRARVAAALATAEAAAAAGSGDWLDEAAARRLLASAYAAGDWMAAEPALDRLTRPKVRLSEIEIVRLAEAAVSLGRFAPAAELAQRIPSGRHRGLGGLALARARLGLGDADEAWRVLLATDVATRAPRALALAEAVIAALGGLEPALALAERAAPDHGAAAWLALAQAMQRVGRHRRARALLRRLWRSDLDPGLRLLVLEARCATSPSGWPARTQTVWAERLARRALAGRAGAAEAVARLADCRWHRPAWRVLTETGCDPGVAVLKTLALGLAWEGRIEEPKALLARLHGAGETLAGLERHVAAIDALAAGRPWPDGPRPATRLLLDALPAPAIAPRRTVAHPRVTHVGTSFSVGGAERQLSLVARGLSERHPKLRQDILMSGAPGGPLRPDAGAEGARIALRAVRGLDAGPTHQPGMDPLTGRAARLQRIEAYRRIFEADAPDAVMVWKPEVPALIGAVLAGVPRVVLRNGSVAPTRRHWMREHQAAISEYVAEGFRWLATRPAMRFVSNSGAALAELTEELWWPPERSSVLHNAFDFDRLRCGRSREASRALLGLPQDATIVGGCFRVSPEKRPLLWLDAAELCLRSPQGQTLVFAIAGGGPLAGALANRVAERGLGGRILLLGQLEGEIADFHNAIDVLLHTAAFEGLPNAVIEAQANGVPAVACGAGGVAEAFLPGTTGALVPAATAAVVAAGVLETVARLGDYRARRADFDRFVGERFGLASRLDRLDELLGLGAG